MFIFPTVEGLHAVAMLDGRNNEILLHENIYKLFVSQRREFVLFQPSNMATMQTLHTYMYPSLTFPLTTVDPFCFVTSTGRYSGSALTGGVGRASLRRLCAIFCDPFCLSAPITSLLGRADVNEGAEVVCVVVDKTVGTWLDLLSAVPVVDATVGSGLELLDVTLVVDGAVTASSVISTEELSVVDG